MSDYYSDCIQEIRLLIDANQIEDALFKIKQELQMPYIPSEVEEQLTELLRDIQHEGFGSKTLSDEEILEHLHGSETMQLLAIKELSERNLRKYLDWIQGAFDDSKSDLVTISLIELCIEQQLNEEYHLVKDGLEIDFVPSTCELPYDCEGVQKCFEILKEWLENENPSLLNLCEQCALKESYLHLPFSIDEEESRAMSEAILRYVCKLMGCEEVANAILYEKNTSQKDTFELLLYSNNI